jgi:methylated-DNA-[protein]-cysteine S-methyltransferase
MMVTAHYQTPIGVIEVTLVNDRITGLELGRIKPDLSSVSNKVTYDHRYRGLRKQLGEQLKRYFATPQSGFDLPLQQQGTPYQQRVWRALQRIPPGHTLTYGQLAKRLHSSPRAIGNACRQNPLPLLVPCHRVVAASGLGGFAGETTGKPLVLKRWLLEHEGVTL